MTVTLEVTVTCKAYLTQGNTMTGKVYLIQSDNQLLALEEQPYANEDMLQTLLEQYPDLLAGDQIDPATPRRWLLVAREMGVPGEVGGGNLFALDHLFLDQDGIPTLVEVKRSSDTRIRREVVAQMLDYAANAVAYWPVESLRARFEATCNAAGDDPSLRLAEFLETQSEDEQTMERFWGQVKTNLQARKLRLIFVADQIPPELRRIVEFLNEQMDPAEVLAVEVRQYVGSGLRTLTPRVIGQTSEAQQKKGSPSLPKRQWDESSFFAELHSRSPEAVPVARAILDWGHQRVTRILWGKGSTQGSFVPTLHHNGTDHQLFAIWTVGTIEFYFYWYQYKPPFDQIAMRRTLLQRLNAIPGINLAEDMLARRPTVPLNRFVDDAALQELLATYTWMLDQIKATT